MKKLLPLVLLCFAAQGFAKTTKQPTTSPYTYSLDFLYWELREGGADNWAQLIAPSGSDQPVKIIDVPFKHSAGFRLGLDYQKSNDFWNTAGIYTHYQTYASAHASGEVYSDYLGNYYAGNADGSSVGPYYDTGDIQWDMRYNTLDLQFGHFFNVDDNLSLQPFFGFKAALINQSIKTQWKNPHSPSSVTPPRTYSFTEASEDLKNDFFGAGPSIGLRSTWSLLNDKKNKLSLIGNILTSMMLGYWRFDDHYQSTQGSTPFSSTINSRNFYSAATMVGGLLGLEYKWTMPYREVALRAGYEAEVWFNQIQYYSFNMGRTNSLMSLQGVTFDVSIKFL